MRVKLREVELKLKEYYKKKIERRELFLKDMAEEYSKNRNVAMEKCVKEILKRERMKREYARIREATIKNRHQTEPEVEVPKGIKDVKEMWNKIKGGGPEVEEWEKVWGREKVEGVIVPWCTEHFGQASETPLARGRWEKSWTC